MTKPSPTPDPMTVIDYRCKRCGEIVPRGTHHKMESCKCGFISVDRGWYGIRILWNEGKAEDAFEEVK
jgi:predicted  nucleic acid-binding Zn-ribbon protein